MSSVERAEVTQKEVLIMSNAVPVEIQERLDALEERRLEIISQNAVDRTAAEYAAARIAERKAEKSRLKIEARALRMAVAAYAAHAVEVEDFGASDLFGFEMVGLEIPDVAAGPEITEVEQPEEHVAGEVPLLERILRILKEADGPLTRREIASAIGQDPDRTSTELSIMKRRNLVASVEGQGWTVP